MKRMLGVGIAVLVAALAWLAAQSSGGPGRLVPELVGKVISIRQAGRPAEKFVTLRAWERSDKSLIRYIRSEETGELATLVEVPGQTQAQLYRWGPGRTQPPPGVPTIPETSGAEPQHLPEGLVDEPSVNERSNWKPTSSVARPTALASQSSSTETCNHTATKPTSSAGTSSSGASLTSSTPTSDAGKDSHGSVAASTMLGVTPSQARSTVTTASPTKPQDDTLLRQLGELDRVGEMITLHFRDKGVQTCVILRKTVHADGTVSLTVRSQATGEIMTVTTRPIEAPVATLISVSPPATPARSHTSRVSVSAANTSDVSLLAHPASVIPPDLETRESFWSRLARRLGFRQTAAGSVVSGLPAQSAVPPPAPAPPPREAATTASSNATPSSETRIIVGPIPTPQATTPTSPAVNLPQASSPTLAQSPAASQPVTQPGTGSRSIGQATASEQRHGLLNGLLRRNSHRPTNANQSPSSTAERSTLSPEEMARLRMQVMQLFHIAVSLPPKEVTRPTLEPPVPFPPQPAANPTNTLIPSGPDPLREPDKYVKRNPARQEVTNAALVASNSPEKLNQSFLANQPVAKPGPDAQPTRKPSVPTLPQTTASAPVPMPLVPLVTDKPRPEAPPPQPPIQPFNTMQVAAVQNPHQFAHIAPPVVPSQLSGPATPVAWTRGPMLAPHQSPVATLALQATQTGTEALALRNTLFLTNVLQASGSPQQREWAAARLAVIEPNRYPFAVEALVQAAKHDPHPAVRLMAIQSLALTRANTPDVRQTLQLAMRDPDPRIREQAGYALQLLGAGGENAIVPAHHLSGQR